MDLKKIENSFRDILIERGLNLNDPNLTDTPSRATKAFLYATRGYDKETIEEITRRFATKFPTKYTGMVMQKNIRVIGMCPHHLKDIKYNIKFGIIYSKEALGLSMIQRIIKLLAARLVMQEDLTTDIVELFNYNLNPKGIAVIIEGHHGCMEYRGIEQDIPTTTSLLTGPFFDKQSTREEFLKAVYD